MTHEVFSELDDDGARVTIRLDRSRPIGTYTVHLDDGPPAGRVDFLDSPDVDGERIVFHTEVDPEHAGRGLAGHLVREVLADSIRSGLTVVPVCPLFARHLAKHGDEFVAEGGTYRKPTKADIAFAMRAARRQGDA
ncbi:MAG: N-acetyltransferase [Acidimicrobiaceae bacterium]|nr:N-acetyltransferase [Acidimicrobiaceae bacterium]